MTIAFSPAHSQHAADRRFAASQSGGVAIVPAATVWEPRPGQELGGSKMQRAGYAHRVAAVRTLEPGLGQQYARWEGITPAGISTGDEGNFSAKVGTAIMGLLFGAVVFVGAVIGSNLSATPASAVGASSVSAVGIAAN